MNSYFAQLNTSFFRIKVELLLEQIKGNVDVLIISKT